MALILFLGDLACGAAFNLKQAFSGLISRSMPFLPSHNPSPQRAISLAGEEEKKEHTEMNPQSQTWSEQAVLHFLGWAWLPWLRLRLWAGQQVTKAG